MCISPRLLAVSLVLLVTISCNIPLDEAVGPYRFVENRPDRADLVGTWTIDAATIAFMKSEGGYDVSQPTSLILKDDGTFVLTRLPDWIENGRYRSRGLLSDRGGHWNLFERNGSWTISLNDSTNPQTPTLWLREPRYHSTPKYKLLVIIGDPDSRESLIFLRQ